MKLLSLVFGLALLATSVLGLAVTGAPGAVRPRLEIRQLAQNQQQFDLYLLALQKFQKMPQSQQTSYYQIAGIHGVPQTSFDGVGQCGSCQKAVGYCTHDSILFLAWHRAYLALFEQQLVSVAKSIAATYPSSTRASYQAAASSLRIPFWDWAAKPPSGNNLPSQVTTPTVSVNGPTGQQSIPNPLYSYKFQSTKGLLYPQFIKWPQTLRYPNSNAANAVSNEARAIAAFNNIRGSLQDQLYQIYSTCDTYSEVGLDEASTGSVKCSNSLEGIHNTVHTTAGGPGSKGVSGGHMTYLPIAAFDPVFWLHHANIDRLFAMWQAVNPNSYGGSQVAPETTWTIAKGSTQGPSSPLTPFHNKNGGFWTTSTVRRWQNFHYTYPEFADSDGSAASINKYINNLYGPNAQATAGSSKRDLLGDVITPLVANNGSLFQYVANIQTARYALNGSYSIYLFNGNPTSEDSSEWIVDSNLIGPMGVLASEAMSASNLVASGSVPLTRTLSDVVDAGGLLKDLTEANVVPYLMQNLQWRIAGPDGTAIDPTSVPDFDLTVYASTATQVSADELPVWSEFIELADITKNLDAGAQPSASAPASASPTPAASGAASANAATPTTTSKVTGDANAKTTAATPASAASAAATPSLLRRRALRF